MMLALFKHVRLTLAHRRGSVALEYAIVAPLMFAMVLGIIEYGFVFYGYSAVQTAANQTARDIAVNTSGITSAESTLNAKLPTWIGPSEVTVVQTTPTDLAKSNIVITAVTDAGNATPIKIFTSMLPMDLTTTVSVKTELPFDESVNPDDDDDDDDDD
jgi:Flp pilus assembly protein TadG